MKVYILCLMGLVGFLEVNPLAAMDESERLEKKMSDVNLSQDKIDDLGEQILSGHSGKLDSIEPYCLQGILDWMQKSMYGGIKGYYSNNQFINIARDLLSDGAVKLDYGIARVGKKQKEVKYISKITVVDSEKTKSYLQNFSDAIAEYNKKYPYRED